MADLIGQIARYDKDDTIEAINKAWQIVRLHLSHIETYGVFGEALFGETFLEQIRKVDGSMVSVRKYIVVGNDLRDVPMEILRATREMIHRLIKMVGNMDAAYTAALFRIRRNIDMALKHADAEVKNAPATEVKKEKKPLGRKVEPLSAIILEENLPEDEHGNKRTAQDLINRLREMINRCERPTDVRTILRVAWGKKYLLRFPTENQYNEIGAREVGSFSSIRRDWQLPTGLEERFNIF